MLLIRSPRRAMPGDGFHFETQALAQLAQGVDIARLLVAEAKVFADQNHAGPQRLRENCVRKFLRRQLREVERKRKQQNRFDPFRFHAAQPLIDGHEQLRRAVGSEHAGGMRIEGQDGGRTRSSRAPVPTTRRMICRWPAWTPSKLPIVTTDGPKACGNLGWRTKDLHAAGHFDFEPVVSEKNAGRQRRLGRGVRPRRGTCA